MTQTETPPITPQWVYDEIMRHIEPDLTTDQIHGLDGKYAGETEEERKDRLAHYAWAYEIFDRCVEDLDGEMKLDAARWKTQMAQEATKEDQEAFENIEQSLEDFDS